MPTLCVIKPTQGRDGTPPETEILHIPMDKRADVGTDVDRGASEAAAREANCEFVWGMPKGFDTESKPRSPFRCDCKLNLYPHFTKSAG